MSFSIRSIVTRLPTVTTVVFTRDIVYDILQDSAGVRRAPIGFFGRRVVPRFHDK